MVSKTVSSQAMIRSLFGIGEVVSPYLAGRVAFELFCRTRDPNKLSQKEHNALEKVRVFMEGAELQFLPGRGGQAVAAHVFDPGNPGEQVRTAIVVHGWHSRAEHMAKVIAALMRKGLRVVAIDLPGHGQSAGRRLTMAHAVEAVHAAEARFGAFEAIVGHSFGGAVAVNAAVGSIAGIAPVKTKRLVLISAPSSMPFYFDQTCEWLGVGPRSKAVGVEQVKRIAGHPFSEYVGARQLAAHPIPTLVIHAPDDKEVSASQAYDYDTAGDHVRLSWAPGLGHRRILADANVLAQVSAYAAGEERVSVIATGSPDKTHATATLPPRRELGYGS